MIDQITVDRIMDAAQIVDVVSDFVTLKRRGVNYVGLCPFHSDKTPSFYVSPSKNICKCFACGEGGTSVHFIMKHEQLSYYEALKFLAKKYSIEVKEKELTDEQKQAFNERESLFILNNYAKDYFINTLQNHLEGKNIGLSYFRERGFRDDIIKKFQLGYSLEQKDALYQDAVKNGYNKEYLFKTGLVIQGENNYVADRFRGRVMFPVHTLSGKVVAFGGRILKKAENTGKYVNSPESEIYHKSDQLYGIYFAKQSITKADRCYLVEGYTDVISMHQAGIENVVASSGTALTHGQIKLIHRFTSNITVLYDGDAAGIKAALRGIDLLLEEGLNIKVVLLPDGEDPDSFARKHNASTLLSYLEQNENDFIRFKTNLLLKDAGNDPIKRAALISDIVKSISLIPDQIIRSVYIRDCSGLLEVDERVLVNEINKQIYSNLDKKGASNYQQNSDPVQIPAYAEAPEEITSSPAYSSALDKFERNVIYYVIRYGNLPLISDPEEAQTDEPIPTVIEYVKFDLERDNLQFQNPLFRQIFEEAVLHLEEEDFHTNKFFLSHPDNQISKIAAEIMSDRYQLSKIYLKQYGENLPREETPLAEELQLMASVPRVMIELKYEYFSLRMKQVMEELSKAQNSGNMDLAIEKMKEKAQLQIIKKELVKILGERIVLKM
ncbi:MAG: primase [Bacteroidetes bacterium]|nr:primase [Bacteroidota bacterium]